MRASQAIDRALLLCYPKEQLRHQSEGSQRQGLGFSVSFLVVCRFLLGGGREILVVGVSARAREGTAAVAAGGKGAEEGCPRVRHHH